MHEVYGIFTKENILAIIRHQNDMIGSLCFERTFVRDRDC